MTVADFAAYLNGPRGVGMDAAYKARVLVNLGCDVGEVLELLDVQGEGGEEGLWKALPQSTEGDEST